MVGKINKPSPQQLATVQWAARIGAVTADALAVRESCMPASARGRLQAAAHAGLLTAARPLNDAPTLYTATRAGLRATGLQSLQASRVTASNARHLIACAAVAAALEALYPDQRLMGERELREREREHGGPLASARLGSSLDTTKLHRPDIVIWPSASSEAQAQSESLPLAIEVELTVKAPQRLFEICRAWARCRCVAGVLYVTAPEVEHPLARAIERSRASDRIASVGLQAVAACRSQTS